MIIDLQKYIADKLPVRLQRFFNIEIIRVLLLQVVKSYHSFNQKVPDWLYKANANASVISLQHHIKREFDVDAIITELDGKPIDFLVSINGFVDEFALKNFIKKWSLAGKSFVFKIGALAFTAKFDNYVCENIIESYTAKFSDYVCEDDRRVDIYVNVVNVDVFDYYIKVTSSRYVESDIDIIVVLFEPNSTHTIGTYTITLANETIEVQHNLVLNNIPSESNLTTRSMITPNADVYYDYFIHD